MTSQLSNTDLNLLLEQLYIMCFGSFIGYSGAFPKLITDLFGYIKDPDSGEEITNPNAPDVFNYSWMGAFVGSMIRPVGGVLSDKFGGAKVTMISIIVCTAAAMGSPQVPEKVDRAGAARRCFGGCLSALLVRAIRRHVGHRPESFGADPRGRIGE